MKLHMPAIAIANMTNSTRRRSKRRPRRVLRMMRKGAEKISSGTAARRAGIGPNTLIGMGAIILNGARIGAHSLVGAGALITEGKSFPDKSLIVGAPARAIRTLDDKAAAAIAAGADFYVRNFKRFAAGMKPIG